MAVKEAKKMAAKRRRESLHQRGIISFQHKQKKEKKMKEQSEEQRQDLELKRLAALDVAAYKKAQKEKKRQSLAARNELARVQSEIIEENKRAEHESAVEDLNDKYKDWLAVNAHKNAEKESRRNSIAARSDYYFTHVKCRSLNIFLFVQVLSSYIIV